jgi:RNA polymerase sigma-70 factor, ECF subfamily
MSTSKSERTLKQLFDQLFTQLVFTSYRIVKDYPQAEEIVQDVFVKVWQNFDAIKHITDKKSYLFKAVKNSSLNFLRHIKVRQKYIHQEQISDATTIKSPEENLSESEIKNRLHEVVNKLPDNWKEAFIKSKYDNLKYREIAKEMNISQKTVEKYISKALQFLRKKLKDILLVISIIIKYL